MRPWIPAAFAGLGVAALVALPAAGSTGAGGTIYACINSRGQFTHASAVTPLPCPSQVPVSWPGNVPGPSPAPSPSPTAPEPSPTSTAAACITPAENGGCGPYNDPAIYAGSNGAESVENNVWNPVPGWSQTLTAYGMGDWSVSADMPAGNTAVVSYPESMVTYTTAQNRPDPLPDFGSSFTSAFTHADPSGPGLDYEWAYDIWLGDTAQTAWTRDQEVMIWTDNHGQVPIGNDTGTAYTDPAGVPYEVWEYQQATPTTVGADRVVSLVRQSGTTSGTVDLSGVIAFLQAGGYTSGAAGIDQVDYGPELCSTGGQPLTFALTSYTLSAVP